MRKLSFLGGWLIVVVATTTITWQIVGAVDEQVSARPVSPLNIAAPGTEQNPRTLPTPGPSTTHMSPSTTSHSGSASTSSTNPAVTTTTWPTTTTSSTTPVAWQTESTTTTGGTVVVQYRPGEVVLVAATPAPGFRAEVEKPGPPEVEVEFESDSLKVEYHASWEDDGLDIEVRESEES